VWFLPTRPGRSLGKTNPLNDDDLARVREIAKDVFQLAQVLERRRREHRHLQTFDLSVKNPNSGEDVKHRSPQEIMDEIAALDTESANVLETIRSLL